MISLTRAFNFACTHCKHAPDACAQSHMQSTQKITHVHLPCDGAEAQAGDPQRGGRICWAVHASRLICPCGRRCCSIFPGLVADVWVMGCARVWVCKCTDGGESERVTARTRERVSKRGQSTAQTFKGTILSRHALSSECDTRTFGHDSTSDIT